MNQIVAIGSKHSPELILNFWIQRDSVNDGAVNIVLRSPIRIRFRVAAWAIVIVLIFALAHSRPRGHLETAPNPGRRAHDFPCSNA